MSWSKKRIGIERVWNRWGWIFISLMLIGVVMFIFYPIVYSLYLSTFSTRGFLKTFVGFGNYVKLLQDTYFILALKNILVILIVQVPIMLFLALIFATLLNDPRLKFKGIYRTALFLPAVTSLVAYTILFRTMFSTRV